jgi:ribosome maturation factor RimP
MEKELEESIKLTVEGCGVNLYDIVNTRENKNNILRIFINSSEGISVDKCAQVSRMLSPLLDIHEPVNGKYILEVSSPGIERKLKTLNHFQNSIGDMVKIKEFSTETFKGKLISVSDDGNIVLEDEETKQNIDIKYDDILSASTYFVWK